MILSFIFIMKEYQIIYNNKNIKSFLLFNKYKKHEGRMVLIKEIN